ncbi:MAG: peptide-methionine (S)-S-oxide reductase MsrA [Gemmataceae bacterium]
MVSKLIGATVVLAVLVGGMVLLWRDQVRDMPSVARQPDPPTQAEPPLPPADGMAVATFGNGCFWCTEAVFQQIKGVQRVTSGYSGGTVKDPTYQQVCTGTTGHAEVIQIVYDPKVISFTDLLEAFWYSHDPTQLNRQGNDVGTQYRSAVFYHTDEQRDLAETYKKKLNESGAYSKPVVTEITGFTEFYPAEKYHQNYFTENGEQGYCQKVIRPKLDKFRSVFKKEKLKDSDSP